MVFDNGVRVKLRILSYKHPVGQIANLSYSDRTDSKIHD
jgi:hypothetical protein